MPMINTQFRTISCENCDKTVTFQVTEDGVEAKRAMDLPENAWLKTTRFVNTPDGRVLVYHDDECEVKGVGSGKHNRPEPKRIVEATNAQAELAAQAAKVAEEATTALKSGQPVTLG
jgi:hypothetical protein